VRVIFIGHNLNACKSCCRNQIPALPPLIAKKNVRDVPS
jgi:hypothetical protein